jgi:hypothetical protein
MNAFNPEQFEAELKRLRPAQPAPEMLSRISQELSSQPARAAGNGSTPRPLWSWSWLLRWVVPACALTALCAGFYWKHQATFLAQSPNRHLASSGRPVLKADKVEINCQWVADFDAVAKLPSGEPVRFRCEQWMDKIQWRDSAKGLVIEQTTPRLEIVPIRFETY